MWIGLSLPIHFGQGPHILQHWLNSEDKSELDEALAIFHVFRNLQAVYAF